MLTRSSQRISNLIRYTGLFNRKKGWLLSNVEYAYILSTGGCIHFLENSGHSWRSQGIFFNCFGRHYELVTPRILRTSRQYEGFQVEHHGSMVSRGFRECVHFRPMMNSMLEKTGETCVKCIARIPDMKHFNV